MAISSTREMLYLQYSNTSLPGEIHITRYNINLTEDTVIYSTRIDNSLNTHKFSRDQVTFTNREIILDFGDRLRLQIDRMMGIRKLYDSQLKKYSGRGTCTELVPSKRKF